MSIGVDIIEIDKIKQISKKHETFLQRVYTREEIRFCEKKKNKYQHFAARFAAKESVFKAIGKGWADGIAWTDVEVINNSGGKPTINTYGKVKKILEEMEIKEVLISLSHCRSYAVAYAQLVKEI